MFVTYTYFALMALTFGYLAYLHGKEAKAHPLSNENALWTTGCSAVVIGSVLAMFADGLLGGIPAIFLLLGGLAGGVIATIIILFDLWTGGFGFMPEDVPSMRKMGITLGIFLVLVLIPFKFVGVLWIFLGGLISALFALFALDDLPTWAEKVPFVE